MCRDAYIQRKQNREEVGTEQKQQTTYQFTQGYNILHRLQVATPLNPFTVGFLRDFELI